MSLSRFRLITFDVTDTLLMFRSTPGRKYGEIGAMYGILLDDNILARNFKNNWYKMNRDHPNFGLKSGLGWEKWWKTLTVNTFTEGLPPSTDDKKLEAMANHLVEVYMTSTCWQQCYGAVDLLNYLSTKPLTIGAISNFDQRLTTLLRNMRINSYFDFVLNSYDAKVTKPDRKIFEQALAKSGIEDIKPEEALHIGDTPAVDYAGAKGAGWSSVLIHEREPEILAQKYPGVNPKHVFRSLYDFHRHVLDDTVEW